MSIELTREERLDLRAIIAYVKQEGDWKAFKWDRASCKKMFYTGPISGRWPSPEQLRRIRQYMKEKRA